MSERPLSLALRFLTLPLLIKTLQRARLQKLAGELEMGRELILTFKEPLDPDCKFFVHGLRI